MNSEQLTSVGQFTFSDTKEAWLRFCPLNSCNQGPWNRGDQAIKDDFLDCGRKTLLLATHM